MAEDHLQVHTAVLGNVQSDIESTANQLTSAQSAMDSDVRANTSMWTSSGSEAATRWNNANNKIAELINHLHQYSVRYATQTGTTSQQFAQAETTNANMWG